MPNGAVALQILDLPSEPASTPDKPAACRLNGHEPTPAEVEIGTLIVRAAGVMFLEAERRIRGEGTWGGGLEAGELIARLYFLQQAMGPSFATVAAREGRRVLRAGLTPEAARRGDLDQAMDEVLSLPLAVVQWVAESERAFARTMAN